MEGHYIVCGMGIVGYRVVELLHRLGERVVVVTLSGHDERIQAARERGRRRSDRRRARSGGPASGSGWLGARALHRDHVEGRRQRRDRARRQAHPRPTFRSSFASSTRTSRASSRPAFQIRRALGMATVAAPRIAAAATGGEVIGRFSYDGEELVVAALEASRRPELVGRRRRRCSAASPAS